MAAHTFSFYSPDLAPSDATLTLAGDEHHHLSRVLRMTRGESIRVTNGRGLIVSADVESIERTRTSARVLQIEENVPTPMPLVLALALLPRAHMDVALTQCIEAGITGLIPVIAERCHVRRGVESGDKRWTRVAIAAMKQSGRGWLPAMEAPVESKGLVARFASFARVVLADGDAPAPPDITSTPAPALAIVGPEAGFTTAERSLFIDAGAKPARLSAHRLRAETAALVLVSMLAINRR
jgi:16S rRNA (uracil1498-N3)-methyltransferase